MKFNNEDIRISILTPTYNRAKLLQRLWFSIEKQIILPFEWIIIDDGSKDNTTSVVKEFNNNVLKITYIKKTNGGKHSAINEGMKHVQGNYVFIVDSDDTLPANSINTIIEQIKKIKDRDHFAGVCGLKYHHDGTKIGSGLTSDFIDSDSINIRYKHHIKGDLAEVIKTSVLQKYPFPEFPNEKFCPEQLIWFRIARKYKIRFFNKPIYYGDYLKGGLSDRITKIRMQSPNSAMLTYKEALELNIPLMQKIKSCINYWRFRECLRENTPSLLRIDRKWSIFMPIGKVMHIIDKKKVLNTHKGCYYHD